MEQECEKVLPMQSLNSSFYKQHGFFVFVWFGLVWFLLMFPLIFFSSPISLKSVDSGKTRHMVGLMTASLNLYIQI